MDENMKETIKHWGSSHCTIHHSMATDTLEKIRNDLYDCFYDKEFLTYEQHNLIGSLINAERYLIMRGQADRCIFLTRRH